MKPEQPSEPERSLLSPDVRTKGEGDISGIHRELEQRVIQADSPANEVFVKFPTAIPGIASMQKFWHPRARHTLVVIRDYHEISDMTPELKASAVAVQHDIARCLECLMDHPACRLTHVYCEGITPGVDTGHNETLQLVRREQLQGVYTQEQIDLDAALSVGLTKGLLIRAAENAELNVRGLDPDVIIPETPEAKEIWEQREDVVLRSVHEHDDHFAVVKYGASHDFVDNVRQWNTERPSDAFSLIVLTPEYVASDEAKSQGNVGHS